MRFISEEAETEERLMWTVDFTSPDEKEYRCIYRVPFVILKGSPHSYMPMMILIGPLHHGLRSKSELVEKNSLFIDLDTTEARYLGYSRTEKYKHMYQEGFTLRVGEGTMEELKGIVVNEEERIRASYAASTACIESMEFVDMIFRDSIFIIELFLRYHEKERITRVTGDDLMDNPCSEHATRRDLLLLENQIPYFILEKLFDAAGRLGIRKLSGNMSLRQLVLKFFSVPGSINPSTEFKHFTDFMRCFFVETLDLTEHERRKIERKRPIRSMHNAEKLESAGVKFKLSGKLTMEIRFEKGCLYLPVLYSDPGMLMPVRNIMAFEQCHYPYATYVSSFIIFWNFLIDTHKDVDLLAHAGLMVKEIEHDKAAKEVNKLTIGIVEHSSYYYDIAESLKAYYKNSMNRSFAKLRNVYFPDLWKGTATVGATVLLLLTLIQTVASVIQVFQKGNN